MSNRIGLSPLFKLRFYFNVIISIVVKLEIIKLNYLAFALRYPKFCGSLIYQDDYWFNNIEFETNEQLYTYFNSSVDELMKNSSMNLSVQIAGVSVNNVLTFLSKTVNIKYSLKRKVLIPEILISVCTDFCHINRFGR